MSNDLGPLASLDLIHKHNLRDINLEKNISSNLLSW